MNRLKLLQNLKSKQDALVEHTLAALANMSDTGRIQRSKRMTAYYQGIMKGSDGGAWTTWEVPSQSQPSKRYNVVIGMYPKVPGGFFGLAKQKSKIGAKIQHLANSDVKVYCSCPDFYWGGAKYNVGANGKVGAEHDSLIPGQSAGYQWDKSVITKAPDKRDPNRNHVLCKHILSVKSVFAANTSKIFSDARKNEEPTPQNASVDVGGSMVTPDMLKIAEPELAEDVSDSVNELVDQMSTNLNGANVSMQPIEEPSDEVDAEEPTTSDSDVEELSNEMANNLNPSDDNVEVPDNIGIEPEPEEADLDDVEELLRDAQNNLANG